MRYQKATEVLPPELVQELQDYVQGSYLYVPRRGSGHTKQRRTDYRVELEKRNNHIYLKHLEGWTNGQLAKLYHLGESSVRRIILCRKREMKKMETDMIRVLERWGMRGDIVTQRYHTVWEIDGKYMLKIYEEQHRGQMERNIQMQRVLHREGIPVPELISTVDGQDYAAMGEYLYMLTEKLEGSNLTDIRDLALARRVGEVLGQLHMAFQKCEMQLTYWDNSLLQEMEEWVQRELEQNQWQMISKEEYDATVENLRSVYSELPRQLIHRDVHLGNFLFVHKKDDAQFSGYIDFDLSQKNIRIFDPCYFLMGILTEEEGASLTEKEWLEAVRCVLSGYESRIGLTKAEKQAIPVVMESIEILCAAYFVGIEDMRCAADAARLFRFVKLHEKQIADSSRGL